MIDFLISPQWKLRYPELIILGNKMSKTDVLRKCIVTGKVQEKDKMLRFTVTPDLQVIPDFKKKLPGKGIYVTNSQTALETAIEKNLFGKALKNKAKVSSELVVMTKQILRKKALDAVSLSRKAGILVTGLDKVLETVKKQKAAFILEALGAGDDGHQRVVLAAKDLEVFRLFDIEELDTALNKVNTVHVAFNKSKTAKMVYNEFNKLADFLNS